MTVALSFKNDPLARQAAEAILIREEEGDLLMVHKSGEAINEEEKLTKEEKQEEERLTKIISDRNKEKARLRKENIHPVGHSDSLPHYTAADVLV